MFDKRRGGLLCISRFLHRVVADSAEVGAWENPQSSFQKEVHRGRGRCKIRSGKFFWGLGSWKVLMDDEHLLFIICVGV